MSKPERVALTDDRRSFSRTALITSDVWREYLGYEPNAADQLLPPGAMPIFAD